MDEYSQNFSPEGKIALIIGAFYGIGFAIARTMAGIGAIIVLNDIKQGPVDKGVAAYKGEGIEAYSYACGVTNEGAANGLVSAAKKEVGVADTLVNNAGIVERTPMCDMSAAELRQVTDMGLSAPFIVSKVVIPGMVRKSHGRIINICSMISELGHETVSAYAVIKSGLEVPIKNTAFEYDEYNIQCNGIGSGYIVTPQTVPLREIRPDGSKHSFDQFIIARTPAGCWGEVEDLGGLAVFLASEASSLASGLVSYVDGGIPVYTGEQPK